jgi:hypothetical protein
MLYQTSFVRLHEAVQADDVCANLMTFDCRAPAIDRQKDFIANRALAEFDRFLGK